MVTFASLFILWQGRDLTLGDEDCRLLAAAVRRLPGLRRALALTPCDFDADHPFAADGRGPPLVLEIGFETSDAADAAMGSAGPLAELMQPGGVPGLAGASVTSQRMTGRDFAVPDPVFRLAAGERPCTFLVDYPGTADDLDGWLDHYDKHHPPIMVRFPQIRAVATYRPAAAGRHDLPGDRMKSMQRNKVVFDSAAALVAALASPVMEEMRADSARFPPFAPRARHHAMATQDLLSI